MIFSKIDLFKDSNTERFLRNLLEKPSDIILYSITSRYKYRSVSWVNFLLTLKYKYVYLVVDWRSTYVNTGISRYIPRILSLQSVIDVTKSCHDIYYNAKLYINTRTGVEHPLKLKMAAGGNAFDWWLYFIPPPLGPLRVICLRPTPARKAAARHDVDRRYEKYLLERWGDAFVWHCFTVFPKN